LPVATLALNIVCIEKHLSTSNLAASNLQRILIKATFQYEYKRYWLQFEIDLNTFRSQCGMYRQSKNDPHKFVSAQSLCVACHVEWLLNE